jgi:hypothetical protein
VDQPQLASLSSADRAALVAGFRPLEDVSPGLPERLLRYVTEGEDMAAVDELARTPEGGKALVVLHNFLSSSRPKGDPG